MANSTDLDTAHPWTGRRHRSVTPRGVLSFDPQLFSLGGLIYWLSIPKTITKPYLLYGEECYMNSRSCDATRGLWCPAGVCICLGDFQWDSTAQNCTCGAGQFWDGFKCQHLGYYGDPCNIIPCAPSLTCTPVISQKYTTSQSICVCDSLTYLSTSGPTKGQCVPRLSHNQVCETNSDCQNWLGLSCTNSGAGKRSSWKGGLTRLLSNRFAVSVRSHRLLERFDLYTK